MAVKSIIILVVVLILAGGGFYFFKIFQATSPAEEKPETSSFPTTKERTGTAEEKNAAQEGEGAFSPLEELSRDASETKETFSLPAISNIFIREIKKIPSLFFISETGFPDSEEISSGSEQTLKNDEVQKYLESEPAPFTGDGTTTPVGADVFYSPQLLKYRETLLRDGIIQPGELRELDSEEKTIVFVEKVIEHEGKRVGLSSAQINESIERIKEDFELVRRGTFFEKYK